LRLGVSGGDSCPGSRVEPRVESSEPGVREPSTRGQVLGPRLLELDEHLPRLDRVAGVGVDLGDLAGAR
jgi:hypothetical protein